MALRIGIDFFDWDLGTRMSRIYVVVLPYIRACCGIAAALLLCRVKVKGNFLLRLCDQCSYEIYLVHQLFILGTLSLMHVWCGFGVVLAIVCGVILVKVASSVIIRLMRLERI